MSLEEKTDMRECPTLRRPYVRCSDQRTGKDIPSSGKRKILGCKVLWWAQISAKGDYKEDREIKEKGVKGLRINNSHF